MKNVLKEQFGKSYFEENYAAYQKQNPSYKLNGYLDLVKKFVPPSKDKKLLDAGCAFGSFLKIANNSYTCYGADISEYAIKSAKKEIPNVKFQALGIETMNFNDKMDVIVSFDCLEHVPDLGQAFVNLKKHSKKGTFFFFVMPVYDGLVGKVVSLLDKDETHINKESRQWWVNKIEENFELVEWYGIFRYLLGQGFYMHKINKFTRDFSPAVLVVARNG